MDTLERRLVEMLCQDFVGAFKGVDAEDQVDVELIQIYKAIAEPQPCRGTILDDDNTFRSLRYLCLRGCSPGDLVCEGQRVLDDFWSSRLTFVRGCLEHEVRKISVKDFLLLRFS